MELTEWDASMVKYVSFPIHPCVLNIASMVQTQTKVAMALVISFTQFYAKTLYNSGHAFAQIVHLPT